MPRSVSEIEATMTEIDAVDVAEKRELVPTNTMSDEDIRFVIAASEDDMDNDDWRKLLEACNGKFREEMARLAFVATSDTEQELSGIRSVADRV